MSTPVTDEKPLPAALCAPGRRDLAALVLWMRNEKVSSIREHPYLRDYGGILLFAPAPEIPAEDIL